MGIRGMIVAVGGAVVLALGGLGLAQASADTGPQKPLPLDTSIPAGTSLAALATSAGRLKFLDDLRNAAAENPQRYGGVATSGDANITLCDNGSGADAAVDTPVSALRASGATVTVTTCAHNLNDLNETLAEVATSTVFSSNSATLMRWGIDYGRNAVEIGVDTIPPGFAEKVSALWGDAVYLMVSPTAHLQSRTNDFSPFFGGDWITAQGYGCTSGFTLTNAYGTHYAIAAGHCFSQGASVSNGGHSMGTVDFRRFGGGAMDNELTARVRAAAGGRVNAVFDVAGKTPVEDLISLAPEPSQVLSIANFAAGQAGARVTGGDADSHPWRPSCRSPSCWHRAS